MKKILGALCVATATAGVFAAEGSFDATSLMTEAQTAITSIVTAFGALIVAASAFYLAKLGYRKFKAAISGV